MEATIGGVIYVSIPGFDRYGVSNQGEVIDMKTGRLLSRSSSTGGAVRVNLRNHGSTITKSVKRLVAEAFLPAPPNESFDTPILLNGEQWQLEPENMAWRPRWYAMKWAEQWNFSDAMIRGFHNGAVRNMTRGRRYGNVYEAGIEDGVLWWDIQQSCETGEPVMVMNYMYEWDVV